MRSYATNPCSDQDQIGTLFLRSTARARTPWKKAIFSSAA